MKNTTVIIIDDNDDYRWILKTFLSRHGINVTDCGCRSSFTENIHLEKAPDIAVISYDSKTESTIQCIEILKRKYPSIKILINSIYEDYKTNKKIFQEGIDGIVPKTHKDPDHIIKALIALARNEKFY
jgi:DNA-binding NarL/FixJ family response regulator